MIDIVGLDIEINRGDSAGLTFHFEGDDVPANGTTVLFQVRPAVHYKYSVLEKEAPIVDSVADITFLPEDTSNMKTGEYYWNAVVQYYDGSEPWTLLRDWPRFTVLPG